LLFILIHLALSPRYARQLYRGRFGIETSYRCTGRVRGWTTAINLAYRFVLIALAFVRLNVWLHLRWLFTQVPRRGGRWLDTTRLPLTRFAAFIRRSLEYLYGCAHIVVAPAVPRCLEIRSTETRYQLQKRFAPQPILPIVIVKVH
jgi:hypothetical protein